MKWSTEKKNENQIKSSQRSTIITSACPLMAYKYASFTLNRYIGRFFLLLFLYIKIESFLYAISACIQLDAFLFVLAIVGWSMHTNERTHTVRCGTVRVAADIKASCQNSSNTMRALVCDRVTRFKMSSLRLGCLVAFQQFLFFS